MTAGRARALLLVAAGGSVVALLAVGSLLLRGRGADVLYGLWVFQNAPSGVLMLWLGTLILVRRPGHAAGRLLLASGCLQVTHTAVAAYADLRLVAAGVSVPLVGDHGVVPAQLPMDAAVALLVMNLLWVPAVLMLIALPLVFPDGRLPGRGWRWVITVDATAILLLAVGAAIDAWPTTESPEASSSATMFMAAGGVGALVTASAGMAAFEIRRRRAAPGERRFAIVGGIALVCVVVTLATYPWPAVWAPSVHIAWNILILAYALAVARFRLHDLEPVVGRRSMPGIAALLAVLLPAVPTACLAVVAARQGMDAFALVAILVGMASVPPLASVVRRGVTQALFGSDLGEDDVLTRIAQYGGRPDDVVRESVRLLLDGTGADRVEFRPGTGPVVAVDLRGTTGHRTEVIEVPVTDGHEEYGVLVVSAGALVDLHPRAHALVDDVARLLVLALRAERLSERVQEQVLELQASRRRLVNAQQEERHRIERDLHDGAQARLIALKIRIEAARSASSDAHAHATFVELAQGVDEIVRELRQLARGVHPHELDGAGIVPALRTAVRVLRLPVQMRTGRVARYPAAVESAIYYTCVEAIQNALRHADASTIVVTVDCGARRISAAVSDDGRGFDPAGVTVSGLLGVEDRLRALGGTLVVESRPGAGATVRAVIDAQERSSAR